MKTTCSDPRMDLVRSIVVEPRLQMDTVRKLERRLARVLLLAFAALVLAILAACDDKYADKRDVGQSRQGHSPASRHV